MTDDFDLVERAVTCPYCGEEFTAAIDYSAGSQEYYEDCRICCRPILFSVDEDAANAAFQLTVKRDDE